MGGRRFDSGQLLSLKGESEPPQADETDPLIGSMLSRRYRVLRRLGEGTQATIYIARHTLIKRQVTVKILHAALAANRDLVRRFLDEAQIVGTMGHPNIVESLDMGVTEDERPYIVLEYLEGDTLTSDLAKGVLDVGRMAYIAQQLASALEAVHQRGIVHRDLKPENVVLIKEHARVDIVKLIDFGISKMDFATNVPSERGLFLGTPEFVAPEQITDPDSVDSRADIYALGVMMYEMLCGETPFEGEAYPEILESIVGKTPRPLGERRPNLPPDLLAIIDRCLRKKRDERYERMSDLEEALAPFAKEPPLETKASRIEARKPTSEDDVPIVAEPKIAPTITPTTKEKPISIKPSATPSSPPSSRAGELHVGRLVVISVVVIALIYASYHWRKEPITPEVRVDPTATVIVPIVPSAAPPPTSAAIETAPPPPMPTPVVLQPPPSASASATARASAPPPPPPKPPPPRPTSTPRAPKPPPSSTTIPTTENPGLSVPPDPPPSAVAPPPPEP